MNTVPKITEAEWEVMRIAWAKSPISAFEIIERLAATDSGCHPKTVRTLIARLVKKKALGFEAHGRVYLYHPLVGERDCLTTASTSFLERVFGGSLTPMIAHFVESRQLSKKELEGLRRLLSDAGREQTPTAKKGH
jgi:BlaI family penicillinase repressor